MTPPHTLLRAGLLADGLGGQARPHQEVLVHEGRIAAVGPHLECPPGTQIIDLGNACLTPGLIDGHTHLGLSGDGRPYAEMFGESDAMMVLIGARNLQLHRDAGITTLREHGARNQVGYVLKEGVRRGLIPGPRLQVSGRPITCTGGHFHMCNEVADGEEEIRRSVRRLVHEGADYIKIMASGGGTAGTIPGLASYTTAELGAAVHEAHYFHRLTAAHCRATDSMRRAVEAGIDLMEHAEFLDPDGQLRFDPELAAMMAECGIWISPTLQAWTRYGRMVELRQRPSPTPAEEQELRALEVRAEFRLDLLRRLMDYKGMRERLVPGTDSGAGAIAFGHLDYDLQLLHQTGLTPAETLVSATRISAAAIGAEKDLGTIEKGKVADLAAFDGDPTRDVGAFSRVMAVFQDGVRVR
ncbi:MAG: amidohydrolase family protein [Candidatus Handelsmanbacteria bacterium]|nr:amidohydrolase family protein [Candidatus Handelsmanbacteria bacterium]